MVKSVKELKQAHGVPCGAGSRHAGCSYSSFKRWSSRLERGEPPVKLPGPKKAQRPDYGELARELGRLKHGRKRSQGMGALCRRHQDSVSRRQLRKMAEAARDELRRERERKMTRITWLCPNVAWSMDDTERYGKERCLHTIQDLASRYKFPPLAGPLPHGSQVARHLERLFAQYGTPLFLKRDNGSNLNHAAVNDLLEDRLVIPLNSPAYYAPYNGAIERTQGDYHRRLDKLFSQDYERENQQVCSQLAAHEMNHQPMDCLGGLIPCRVHFGGAAKVFNRRKRKEAYDWIRDRSLAIMEEINTAKIITTETAWRAACLSWLLQNGLVIQQKGRNCYPISPEYWLINN
jgi:transposase InsO family protein